MRNSPHMASFGLYWPLNFEQTVLRLVIKTHDSGSRGQEEAQQRDH